MIVPELPADIAALKRRSAAFSSTRSIRSSFASPSATRSIPTEVDALRTKARAAGFAMLNMPAAHGGRDLSMLGQVALEEESGKATNGLGFAVVDRGPRELLEIATSDQVERYLAPIARGEYREAWALTEPGAGSDLSGLQTTAVRDGDEWVLNGEKWFVTSEGDPGFYIVAAMVDDEQTLFLVEPGAPGLEITRTPRFLHDPYLDNHPELVLRDCRVPEANRVPASGDAGAKEWILVERLFIAARCCGAAERLLDAATAWAQEREAFGSPIAEYQGVSFPLADSLTELLAARLAHLPRGARVRHRSQTARSCTGRSRWPSSTPPRWRAAWPIALCRSSAGAATCTRTLPPGSTASSGSTASGRERARSSASSSPAAC